MYVVKDDDEAVKLANDSHYGLGGAVFSQNIERAKRMASRIETGMVYINWLTDTAAELPFGGVKRSGSGRELSDLGIKGVCEPEAGSGAPLIPVAPLKSGGPCFSQRRTRILNQNEISEQKTPQLPSLFIHVALTVLFIPVLFVQTFGDARIFLSLCGGRYGILREPPQTTIHWLCAAQTGAKKVVAA